jgi:8-oxo-dGTP diphosphatase
MKSGAAAVTAHIVTTVYTRFVEEPESISNSRPPGPALRFVVAGLLVRNGVVLICQRRPDQPMALQWEFPGGKIEPGESPEQALVRELQEELGIRATIGSRVTHIRHNYRHGGAVDLQFFAIPSFEGELENKIFHQFKWVKLEELPEYEFLAADRGLIRDLAAGKLL